MYLAFRVHKTTEGAPVAAERARDIAALSNARPEMGLALRLVARVAALNPVNLWALRSADQRLRSLTFTAERMEGGLEIALGCLG